MLGFFSINPFSVCLALGASAWMDVLRVISSLLYSVAALTVSLNFFEPGLHGALDLV